MAARQALNIACDFPAKLAAEQRQHQDQPRRTCWCGRCVDLPTADVDVRPVDFSGSKTPWAGLLGIGLYVRDLPRMKWKIRTTTAITRSR